MDPSLQSLAENRIALRRNVGARAWETFDAYLFDVDGTLLNCKDAVHYFGFCKALKALSGRELTLDGVTTHGNTDLGILRDALTLVGIPESHWNSRIESACEIMCAYVNKNRDQISASTLPGVCEVLQHLRCRNAKLGVATGNLQAIGRIKLESCNLLSFFDFQAFSDGLESRTDVYGRAIERARSFAGARAAICAVGDTPADIRAAHHHGIGIIAVATGIHSRAQLSAEQPDLLLVSLSELLQ